MSLAKRSIAVVVAALCLCIAVESWFSLAHPLARLPVATVEQRELFKSMRSIEDETSSHGTQPYMVLLGSSLIVAPVVQAESLHRQRAIQRFSERRATACEHALDSCMNRSASQMNVRVFNAAIGGGMASDDYFIARAFLEAKNKPVALVCGIAPRDFQDNLVRGTYSTDAFQTLSNFSDLKTVFGDTSLSLDKKCDIALGRVSKLWRNRADVRSYYGLVFKKLIEKVCPFVLFEKYGGTTMGLAPQKDGIFPEEVKGATFAYPGYELDHYESAKTCQLFLRCYNPVNEHMVDEQFAYFERMLELARNHGVEILVVNMPLGRSNKKLLALGFYESYLQRVRAVCARHDVQLTDFNTPLWDTDDNFIDTVHLSSLRSNSFILTLMQAIADSPLSLALSGHQKLQIGAKSGSQPQ